MSLGQGVPLEDTHMHLVLMKYGPFFFKNQLSHIFSLFLVISQCLQLILFFLIFI